MIDLGMKNKIEKESEIEQKRMDEIAKEFEKFRDEMITKHNLLSVEYLALLNNLAAKEIRGQISDIIQARANKNISKKIINN